MALRNSGGMYASVPATRPEPVTVGSPHTAGDAEIDQRPSHLRGHGSRKADPVRE